MRVVLVFFVISILFDVGSCAKILAVFAAGAHSHFVLGLRIVKELAARGHNITFINAYPQKTPIKNVREISVAETLGALNEMKKGLYDMGQMSYPGQLTWVSNFGQFYTEQVLKSKGVQELLQSNEEFDIVFQEHFVNEAFMIFPHRFKCPSVLLIPSTITVFNGPLVSNPLPSAYFPNFLAPFGSHMSFWERLWNTYYDIVGELYMHNIMIPAQDALLKRAVPGAPDLEDILYKASLMLLTSHISLKEPVPLQPNVKEIGGSHVGPLKALPKDLQTFLDEAKEGVIVFSMGSNLKSSDFPKDKKEAILKVFSKLKQKVLWKFEKDLPEKPQNVRIMSWLPQQEVLAHPNVVAFISHVGLLGTIEALYHGVPLLGLPVYWDQEKNTEDAIRKGFALKIPFPQLNEENFRWALNELINNPKYRENAKLLSSIMHDQPMKQLDEAVFWIEYVIRHKGAPHLRSAAMDLRWYQRYLVDVALVLVIFVVTLSVTVFCLCKRAFSTKKSKSKKE